MNICTGCNADHNHCVCADIAATRQSRSDPLLAAGVSIIQRLQDDLLECLQSYAMTEAAQVQIMGLLKEATLFRRKANDNNHDSAARR